MSVQKWVVGLLVMGSVLTQEVAAQDKAVSFAVRGGNFSGITELDDAGTADFKDKGGIIGLGVAFELGKHLALRGDVDLGRNELQVNDVGTGQDVSRLFYDASIQFQYPIKNFKPYLFVGAGAVRLHPVGIDDSDETEIAGTGGLGVSYTIPGTQLGVGVEGKSWLYKLSGLGDPDYDKLQFEAAWTAKISYRIPLGAQPVRASR